MDAVVLGKRIPRGEVVNLSIVGRVDFYDDGKYDPKYICSENEITDSQLLVIFLFFKFYAFAKTILNRLRGRRGRTYLDRVSEGGNYPD